METKGKLKHPGVYIPPPVIYAGVFFLAYLPGVVWPLGKLNFGKTATLTISGILILLALCGSFPALLQFLKSKNTVVTVKPANSLQTTGIYTLSRNPMYLGLVFLYAALSLLLGNIWHIISIPALVLIVQEYVIKREERYLESRFGEAYLAYKKKVRRWL